MNETRYPLSWPANWKRTPASERKSGQFCVRGGATQFGGRPKNWLTVSQGVTRILNELRVLDIDEDCVLISTNVPTRNDGLPRSDRVEPTDPGAAVYWTRKGKKQCMAIDRYTRVADNLAAIAATLDALRAIERHGGGSILDRAFEGFAQLKAGSVRPWREVLRVGSGTPSRDGIEEMYRALARKNHPDLGGSHDAMAELNAAYDQALRELGT